MGRSARLTLSTMLVIAVCIVDSVTIAYDGSLMGSLNVMPSYVRYFDLTTATTAVNTCATFLGSIFIGPVTGIFIDKYGRKYGLYAAVIMNVIGAAISGGAINIGMFIAGRIIIGIGVGLGQTTAGAYIAETTAPQLRSLALGLYFACWAAGSLIAAGISYGSSSLEPSDWAWRLPSVLQAAPALLVSVIVYFAPESPRWLACQDRLEEALVVLARINGAGDDVHDENVQMQYREIVGTLEYEKTAEGRSMSFADMFKSPANRKRLFLALSIAPLSMLTGSSIITYYFGSMLDQAGVTDATTQLQINVILSAWQLVTSVAGALSADKLGRRLLCLISLGSCSFFFYLFGGLTAKYGTSDYKPGTYGTIACMFLFLGSYAFGITPLTPMYGPEVLSYNMRANGLALQGILIKCGGVLVAMAFPYLMTAIGWKTYVVNASWNLLFWAYVYFQWVETRRLTLEEVDAIFDGVVHFSDNSSLEKVITGDNRAVELAKEVATKEA